MSLVIAGCINIGASNKWVTFQFWVSYLFKTCQFNSYPSDNVVINIVVITLEVWDWVGLHPLPQLPEEQFVLQLWNETTRVHFNGVHSCLIECKCCKETWRVLLVSAFHPHLRFIKTANFDESQTSVSSYAITTFIKKKKKEKRLPAAWHLHSVRAVQGQAELAFAVEWIYCFLRKVESITFMKWF